MKKVLIGLLTVLLLVTTGAAAVIAEGEPDVPECIGEECEVAPNWIPCEGLNPDCLDLD